MRELCPGNVVYKRVCTREREKEDEFQNKKCALNNILRKYGDCKGKVLPRNVSFGMAPRGKVSFPEDPFFRRRWWG